MSSESKSTSKGVGIGTLVFLVFLVLKLAEIGVVAKWSWWWVTAPLWAPICLLIIGLIIYVIYVILFKK
jgi:hypothetical protein